MTQLLLTTVALGLLVLHSRKQLSKLGRRATVVTGSTDHGDDDDDGGR